MQKRLKMYSKQPLKQPFKHGKEKINVKARVKNFINDGSNFKLIKGQLEINIFSIL